MIDTPITKKFYKKLELYLELKRQDKRSKKSIRGTHIWSMEKAFLLWAIEGHWHMGTPLDFGHIKKVLKEAGFSDNWTKYANQVMQNLVFKKFAIYFPEGENSIQITNEGFLMAEVIEESRSEWEYVYILFIIFTWFIFIFGLIKIIYEIFT
jgi:hypothetical protein